MKKICKSLIVFFTVSWLTAPAYASDPCASGQMHTQVLSARTQ